MPDILKEICFSKSIKVIEIDNLDLKWVILIFFYRVLKLIGIKKHEWSNEYYWNINLKEIETLLKDDNK